MYFHSDSIDIYKEIATDLSSIPDTSQLFFLETPPVLNVYSDNSTTTSNIIHDIDSYESYGSMVDPNTVMPLYTQRAKVDINADVLLTSAACTEYNDDVLLNQTQRGTETSHENNIDYSKPNFSYSSLSAMAIINSPTGSIPVSDIYKFICQNFPYFRKASQTWKNSVRHNLSLNKSFIKIDKPSKNGKKPKGCLWAMNPNRMSIINKELLKISRKYPFNSGDVMFYPEELELEAGLTKYEMMEETEESEQILEVKKPKQKKRKRSQKRTKRRLIG